MSEGLKSSFVHFKFLTILFINCVSITMEEILKNQFSETTGNVHL